jgi:hypothetical protein
MSSVLPWWKRCAGAVIAGAVVWAIVLPSLVLLNFHLHRAEIVRNKCVERYKPVEQNTCKGACHLKKQLARAADPVQKERPAPRVEPLQIEALPPNDLRVGASSPFERAYPAVTGALRKGHPVAPDHVPWMG